ncbi:MAG: DUF4424 family protein [Planctomycetota bacterium]
MMKPILLAALLSTLSLNPLMADVAPMPSEVDWHGLHADKDRNESVRMAWEIVDLTPGKTKNLCRVEFSMVNDGDKPCTFEVGFPSLFDKELKDFKVEVDGKPQMFKVKKLGSQAMTLDGKEEIKDSTDERLKQVGNFRSWLCWDMTFAPKQEVKIVVSYWTEPEAKWYAVRGPRYRGDVHEAHIATGTGTRWVEYILQTGAGWKGAIGKATLRIHHTEIPVEQFEQKPSAWEGGKSVMWNYDAATKISSHTYTELEPTKYHNIIAEYRISTVAEELEALKKYAKEKSCDEDLTEYLQDLEKEVAQNKSQ